MSKGIGSFIAGVVIVGGAGLMMMSTHKINPGYTGIIYSMNGGVEDTTLGQGFHVVSPFKKVIEYPTSVEQGYLSADSKEGSKEDDSFNIPTADGKTVNVDLEYSYYFIAEDLPETFTKFKGQSGSDIENNFMRGKLKTYVGEISSTFSVLDIYGEKRQELNNKILEHVRSKFLEYGIYIETVNISRIGLDAQTEQAIQDKINRQQELETAKIEKEKAQVENEKKTAQIQAEAEQKYIKAQAEAEAILIEAEAQAEANRLLSESINQNLIDMEKIKTWNGELPTVSGGTTPIIDLR